MIRVGINLRALTILPIGTDGYSGMIQPCFATTIRSVIAGPRRLRITANSSRTTALSCTDEILPRRGVVTLLDWWPT